MFADIPAVVWVTGIVALVLLVTGLLSCVSGARCEMDDTKGDLYRNLGPALVAGACITAGVAALQFYLDDVSSRVQQQAEAEREARELQLRQVLAVDLTGFDAHVIGASNLPPHFTGKTLRNAHFEGMDLRGKTFRDADLRGAKFTGANLSGVDLVAADLTKADLTGADLSGAKLQDADLDGKIWSVRSFAGAEVDRATCWPRNPPDLAGKGLVSKGEVTLSDGNVLETYGHVCHHQETFFTPNGRVTVSPAATTADAG
jgi:hypothetical protein